MPANKTRLASKPKPKPKAQPKLFELCASDIMQEDLVTVRASDSLRETERILSEAQIGGAPVIDDNGAVLGVVSLRDLARHRTEDTDLPEGVEAEVFEADVDETEQVAFERPERGACAADVMTQEIVSVAPTALVTEIARRMVETQVHRVLVLERGRLQGLVSTMDVLRVVAKADKR